MAFIHDFWKYCSCYEVTRNNAIWTALGLLGVSVNRKVYCYLGDIFIPCDLYVLLISEPGAGKSTTLGFAVTLHNLACPEIQISASKQSHGDIIKVMSSGDCSVSYIDHYGKQREANVYACYVDEFKNFIAYDVLGMISFLTGIYCKEDKFDAGTLSRGREIIQSPSLHLIGCENPDVFVRYIKADLISGGFGRRVNIIYETSYSNPVPRPQIPPDVKLLYNREDPYNSSLVKELARIKQVVGEFKFTPDGAKKFDELYYLNHTEMLSCEEPVYRGWKKSKPIQLLKVAMLLDVSQNTVPTFKFSPDLLSLAATIVDSIEPNMPKLFRAGGRNELAFSQQQTLQMIDERGGWMLRKEWEKISTKDLNPLEQMQVLAYLQKTEQLILRKMSDGKIEREFIFTNEGVKKAITEGRIKV